MHDIVQLTSGPCRVELSPSGAEVWSWRIDGRDLIWDGNPDYWPRRSPILFPFCGWLKDLKFRAKGREYPTEVHGFGRTAAFHIEKRAANLARMTLHDTPETLQLFPYAFRVTADVTVSDTGFSYAFAVENPGNEVLPFSLGFHPGFLWPFDGGEKMGYRLEFDRPEKPEAVKIAPGGLFLPGTISIPMDGAALDLTRTFAEPDSIVIRNSASGSAAFIAPSGRRIVVTTTGFPNWVIWTKPGAGYLCVERWSGEGDPVDFAGEIIDKPGMTLLAPGEARHFTFRCEFL